MSRYFPHAPCQLPQHYEVDDPVPYSYSRFTGRNYRFHPYLGPPSSRQEPATLSFLKNGPPNVVALPVAGKNARLKVRGIDAWLDSDEREAIKSFKLGLFYWHILSLSHPSSPPCYLVFIVSSFAVTTTTTSACTKL